MEKKVSVIIPFYNRVDWLCEAVQSVLNQTYKKFEIIVVNDGSPENVDNFLDKYGDKIRYRYKENGGAATARNLAMGIATGDYLAFLDSDDLWLPDKLEMQLNYMMINNLVWSHTSYELFNSIDRKSIRVVDVTNFYGEVFLQCLISSPIATPCVMIKSDFLQKNPHIRFADNMRFGQDGFMWLNMAKDNNLGVLNTPLSRVRIRGGNAALRARVHLQVKAQIWSFIREQMEIDEDYKSIPCIIKYAYQTSYYNNYFVAYVEKSKVLGNFILEILSKIFYLPSFLLLRISAHKYNQK